MIYNQFIRIWQRVKRVSFQWNDDYEQCWLSVKITGSFLAELTVHQLWPQPGKSTPMHCVYSQNSFQWFFRVESGGPLLQKRLKFFIVYVQDKKHSTESSPLCPTDSANPHILSYQFRVIVILGSVFIFYKYLKIINNDFRSVLSFLLIFKNDYLSKYQKDHVVNIILKCV